MNLKLVGLIVVATVGCGGGTALKHVDGSVTDGPDSGRDVAAETAPDAADANPAETGSTTDATAAVDATDAIPLDATDATNADAQPSDGNLTDGATADGGTPLMGSKLVVVGAVQLIGSGSDSCTNQVPATGDRWCAFAKTGAAGFAALWVVDVTKVASGVPVKCDGTDASCLRLSSALFEDPSLGFRVDGFDGDTLTYLEDPSSTGNGFIGNVFAWRPGWAAPHNLTGSQGFVCNGHKSTKAAACLSNPVADQSGAFVHTVELHAGVLDDAGTPLPLIDTLIVATGTDPQTSVKKWSARLSPDGKSIAWSTRATDTGTENLHVQTLGVPTSRVAVANDVSQWTVTADSAKWLWLAGYNYDTSGIAPVGALQSATFPGGGGVQSIAAAVGDFLEAGPRGVIYRGNVAASLGNLVLVPDRDAPNAVTTLDQGVQYVYDVTKDGKRATYAKDVQAITGTSFTLSDLWLSGAAGASPCALSTKTALALLPPSFLAGGGLVVWGRYNSVTQAIEGAYASTSGCATHKFAQDLFSFTPIGDEGLVFLDDLNPDPSIDEATLRYAKVENGALPSTGTPIQTRAGLTFATLLPSLPAVIYNVTTGGAGDGIYVDAPLPFTTTP